MLEALNKAFLLGVGLATVTKEKVEQLAKELTEKGELSIEQGNELVKNVMKTSEQAKQKLESEVEKVVNKVLEKAHLPSKADIEKLQQRIKNLEKAIKKGE